MCFSTVITGMWELHLPEPKTVDLVKTNIRSDLSSSSILRPVSAEVTIVM